MRILLVSLLIASAAFAACVKRKPTAPPPSPETATSVAPQSSDQPAEPKEPSAPAAKPSPNIGQVETGVEFGDLNNLIAGFEIRNKRLPTVDELKKLYYGGSRPIPIPPGFKLVIDPKTKTAKLAPGN